MINELNVEHWSTFQGCRMQGYICFLKINYLSIFKHISQFKKYFSPIPTCNIENINPLSLAWADLKSKTSRFEGSDKCEQSKKPGTRQVYVYTQGVPVIIKILIYFCAFYFLATIRY